MIPILLYHQIAHLPAEQDPKGLAVSPQQFEQQMAYLHRAGYQCLSLGAAVHRLRSGLRYPRRSFVITFDDGFQDICTTVRPILNRFGFTATVFFVAGRAGYKSDWEGQNGPLSAQLLTWTEIQELASSGFTFGSHTLTHPRLTHLEDWRAGQEIRQSKLLMEEYLNTEVDFFSYPYSNYNPKIQEMVAGSGYLAACGGDRQNWGDFNLWRAQCGANDSILAVALKASGWYHRIFWLREQSPAGPLLRRVARFLRWLRGSRQVELMSSYHN